MFLEKQPRKGRYIIGTWFIIGTGILLLWSLTSELDRGSPADYGAVVVGGLAGVVAHVPALVWVTDDQVAPVQTVLATGRLLEVNLLLLKPPPLEIRDYISVPRGGGDRERQRLKARN